MNTSIVKGSMSDIAKQEGQDLATTWMGVDLVAIVDVSGSMDASDSRDNQTRFEVAQQELAGVQNSNPGRIAVIQFSNTVQWRPTGKLTLEGGSTGMLDALQFIKPVDGVKGLKIVVISDGYPDNPQSVLAYARQMKTPIQTIYVGPENDRQGQEFLKMLATATGGKYQEDFKVAQLENKITG